MKGGGVRVSWELGGSWVAAEWAAGDRSLPPEAIFAEVSQRVSPGGEGPAGAREMAERARREVCRPLRGHAESSKENFLRPSPGHAASRRQGACLHGPHPAPLFLYKDTDGLTQMLM